MSGSAPEPLIRKFGDKIAPKLERGGFTTYSSGQELPFLKDIVEYLDNTYARHQNQTIFAKCKYAHGSPLVAYSTLSSSGKQSVELGDILLVCTFWRNKSVAGRQAFVSQTKCQKWNSPGRMYWTLRDHQHKLLATRPEFKLDYSDATTWYDLSAVNKSFLNYSFVGDIHRPFFYTAPDMEPFIDASNAETRFYYGRNPPSSNRYLLSTVKNTLRERYGVSFSANDTVYELIGEIYRRAKLDRSHSVNQLPPYTDGGQPSDGFAIVSVDVDTDGSIVNLDYVPDDKEELSQGIRVDMEDDIASAFEGIDDEGLAFDRIDSE